jgi:hypothetical protein
MLEFDELSYKNTEPTYKLRKKREKTTNKFFFILNNKYKLLE